MSHAKSPEKVVQEIRRKTRRQFSAEEKIRIVLEGLRGEESIAALCRREGLNPNLYYRWSKEFLEANTLRRCHRDGRVHPGYADEGGQRRDRGRSAIALRAARRRSRVQIFPAGRLSITILAFADDRRGSRWRSCGISACRKRWHDRVGCRARL